MEHNKIEIEFIDRDCKEKFKQLIGDNAGPFFEKLFPWPPLKLNGLLIEDIDKFMWSNQTRGLIPGLNTSQISSRSEKANKLTYNYTTPYFPLSYKFIRNLAFLFPIRRIVFSHHDALTHVCMSQKKLKGMHTLNCCHPSCFNYALPHVYDLDWKNQPHPIYEVYQTMNKIINGANRFSADEFARIYHYLIHENTMFGIYENKVIKNARTVFEEQVAQLNNPYLHCVTNLSQYGDWPLTKSTDELIEYARSIENCYSQPKNRGKIAGPVRVR